jgi:hypothetical protein
MPDIPRRKIEETVGKIKTYARVALHFHTDRPDSQMNGGQMYQREHNIFGGAHRIEGTTNME